MDESLIAENDREQVREAEEAQVSALKRKLAHTTDHAKRAELNNRLARMGHDPNEDSLTGDPVPERKSPPRQTADAPPDTDFNKAAAKARDGGKGMSTEEPIPVGVESDKLPGDQEFKNFESGEREAKSAGEQDMPKNEPAKTGVKSDFLSGRRTRK